MIPPRRLVSSLVLLALVVASACKDEPSAIAVLTETSPGTEKEPGTAAWAAAAVGAKFFRGDAVRTADGTALLSLGANAALRVQPHSLIRFGEQNGKSSIDVQLGEATIEGTGGKYQLKLGDVTLDGQTTVKISAGDNGNQLELVLGKATLEQNGQATAMEAGVAYSLGLGETRVDRPDAAPPPVDAAPPPDAAEVDAAPEPPAEVGVITVTGKNASYTVAGDPTKHKLAPGTTEVPSGAKVDIGKKTTAKASGTGVTVAAPPSTRVTFGGDPFVGVTGGGKFTATGSTDAEGAVAVPGGHLVLKQGSHPAGATIEIKPKREARIVVLDGKLELVGKRTVELAQGETAVIRPDGVIEVREEIPKYFDLRVAAGEKFTVHDPAPPTAIRFTYECAKGGTVELTGSGERHSSTGADGANVSVRAGSWSYRVKCGGKALKSGKLVVKRDDARRELPPKGARGTNPVDADGKSYTVSYQNLVPNVEFSWPGGTSGTLHLNKGSQKKSIPVTGGKVTVPGSDLKDGSYTFFFVAASGEQSKITFLAVKFDNAVPSVYIESPKPTEAFGAQITVGGQTLSGWTVSVDGGAIEVDHDGRFNADVSAPSANALAIKLSHPRQGVHYYLRRHP